MASGCKCACFRETSSEEASPLVYEGKKLRLWSTKVLAIQKAYRMVKKVKVFFNRWRIVIHGGIDGFSRIPVYLKASNNNKALSTVLSCFREIVSEYGLPSRVRSKKGGENANVATYMFTHIQRVPDRGSMITGTKY
ncbi:unnamed protein product [Porites evermanni]|uniref:Integrase core domain-containing protein n=1 Tax=Porites evermanni TaxID=104178 RepID=A0ABN8SQD3_9CNID|nr:unnamed protein product [Porites evermanni]